MGEYEWMGYGESGRKSMRRGSGEKKRGGRPRKKGRNKTKKLNDEVQVKRFRNSFKFWNYKILKYSLRGV